MCSAWRQDPKMATRPLAAFDQFKTSLEPTSAQKQTISSRKDTVRGYIATEWLLSSATFGGSYGRDTKVRAPADGKSDVDIFFVLDRDYRENYSGGYYSKQPGALLDDIKTTLDKSLETPRVRRDAPAVRITYRDLLVDVVPAFRRWDGDLDIPRGSSWMRATPEKQARVFSDLNANRGYRLKPLIKVGKYWLGQHPSLGMRSYHFEAMVYEHFSDYELSDYRYGAVSMFSGLAWRVKHYVNDPGGSGSDVAGYMGQGARQNAADRFQTAANAAQAAIDDPTYEGEITRWRKLFGPRFPSYG